MWYGEFDKVKWTPPEQAAESIILLINKLIFARTIEDFGLVQYRFLQDEFARFTKLWEPKGAHRIVPKFLEFFEEFFDEYYDTEIFSQRILERLGKDPANLRRFCEKLNFVLGINAWDQTFSRGIVHYNYRRIDEDIFGKSYEMFLAANRTTANFTSPSCRRTSRRPSRSADGTIWIIIASLSLKSFSATFSAWTRIPARSRSPRPTSGKRPSNSRPPTTTIAS